MNRKEKKARELYEQKWTSQEIARELDVTPATVSRLLKAQESPVDISGFKCISWDRYARRFVVRIKGEFVGRYSDIHDAVYYRNKKASELFGYTRAARDGYINDPFTLERIKD